MSSAQLHYNSKPVSTLARQSYISSLTIQSEQQLSHSTQHNALLKTVYKNLRQKRLILKSEQVILAAAKSYTPVAHHFLSATEEFVNEIFKPANTSEDFGFFDESRVQQEEQSLTTHSAQVIRLCGTRALQCLPKQRISQISSALKLVGNFRWTPASFSKLAFTIDECLAPTIDITDDHSNTIDENDVEYSLVSSPEHEELDPVHSETLLNQVSSPSIKEFDYPPSSQSTSSMVFHDDGPYRIDSDACSDISLPPSTSSLLSVTDSLSTAEFEAKDWCSRRPSIPFLTSEQSWLGKSTQTVVTVTDATGRFVSDRKVTELLS